MPSGFWGGLDIWVSSTSLKKDNIGTGLNSLRLERFWYHIFFWDFWWSIPLKGTKIGHLVPGMMKLSGSIIYLMKWGLKGHWGHVVGFCVLVRQVSSGYPDAPSLTDQTMRLFNFNFIIKPNYFKKQSSSLSFLLALGNNTGPKWQWRTEQASSMSSMHRTSLLITTSQFGPALFKVFCNRGAWLSAAI